MVSSFGPECTRRRTPPDFRGGGPPSSPRPISDLSGHRPRPRAQIISRKQKWTRVTRILELGRIGGYEPRPRRGAGYRGRLGKLLREFRILFHRNGGVAACSAKGIGAKTRHDRRHIMTSMLIEMYRGQYQLCYLKNFRAKHALNILEQWKEQGLAASTMATYVSHLRTFVVWLRKGELLEVIDGYCAARRHLTQRQAATTRDKSEWGAKVEFLEILQRAIATGNEYFVCQLLLMRAFGLRAREAWAFRPHLCIDLMGRVQVDWGTKGGRRRTLPAPLTPLQREALERARTLVRDRDGSMIPIEYSMEQWSNRFYRLTKRIGLTRARLGATAHSLRHGALIELYEGASGERAPVRGGMDRPASPARERAARTLVAEVAGHGRLQVSSAYLGSRRRKRPGASTAAPLPEVGSSPEDSR